MIFVPSVDGLSHNVNEYTRPEHVEPPGAAVLMQAVRAAGAVTGPSVGCAGLVPSARKLAYTADGCWYGKNTQ